MTESVIAPPESIASLPWGHNILLLHKLEFLPKNLKGSLPTVAEIEAELDNARIKKVAN